MKEIIQIKRTSFSNQTLNSTVKSIGLTKADLDHSTSKTKETIDLKSNSRKSKFVAEEKQSSGNQINPGEIKLK